MEGVLRYDHCTVKKTKPIKAFPPTAVQAAKPSQPFWKLHWQILLVGFLLFAALFVRALKIEYIPFQSDGDELAYVFAGQSLIEKGRPISWSSFDYPDSYEYNKVTLGESNYNADDTFRLITPWFDHPFVLPLVIGGWVELFGYHFPSIPPSTMLRWPMLVFAALTLYLVYALAKEWFGYWSGVFSLFLIGFSPVFIFAQRMVVGENLVTPFLLLAIYMAVKQKRLAWVVIPSVLAGLSKFIGLIVIPIVVVYYLIHQEYKKAAVYAAVSLGSFALIYGSYGYLLGWEEFLAAFAYQSRRLLGWSNPAFILSNPGFHHFVVLDMSYYLILLLGMGSLLFSKVKMEKKQLFLVLTAFILFITIWITSAEQDMLGWYKIPFFTILAVAAGQVIVTGVMPVGVLLLLWVTILNNFGLVRYPAHPLPEALNLRLILAAVFGVTGLGLVFSERPWGRWLVKFSIACVVVAYIASSVYVSHRYYQAFCRDRHCPVPTQTIKQFLLGDK